MDTGSAPVTGRDGEHEKRAVALSSVLAAVLLTTMKLTVGLLTGSLGILSEAAHSALDLAAAGMTLFAARLSGRPADQDHTYGHGKVENLSALFETVLLLVTCVWIVYEAIQRLFFKTVEVEATVWSLLVMVISIGVDFGRSRALARAARKYNSQALEADALHFSTDIWSSSVVIGGLVLVRVGEATGLTWLAKADAVAAMGVAGIVSYVSLQLGRRTVAALLDAIPAGLREDSLQAVRVPGVDVVVHVEPGAGQDNGLLSLVRQLAARHGLSAHGVSVYDVGGTRSLELHLEVSESLSLGEAHTQATAFEEALQQARPDVEHIVTHLEPVGDETASRHATPTDEFLVLRALKEVTASPGLDCRPHQVVVRRVGRELFVSFHCALPAAIAIGDAHQVTTEVERALRARLPQLGPVVIHVEPPEEV
ncbi:MAG: cation-efflux pump [Chloroflexota bacterium]